MDKIYSRPRIKIFYSSNKQKSKKKLFVFAIMIITILTLIGAISSLNPIFKSLCEDKANKIATQILNEESTKVLKKYSYKDFLNKEYKLVLNTDYYEKNRYNKHRNI